MGSRIKILDEKTINQIAAGEVIESPASCVKELVDNAIDSGASVIQIEVQGSGRQRIKVSDNGSGMSRDDALLCIERHATSKIAKLDDLFSLETMGFRGEALSSIASISEFSLITAPHTSDGLLEGTALSCHGGKIVSCVPTKCFGGTTVEIRSLFFNVPARRKFQKTPAKDASDIVKIVSLLALAHPEIGFELVVNQKKELQLEKGMKDRCKELLGADFFSQLIPVHYTQEGLSISGYIGKPHAARTTRSGQYLFVNRRPVTSFFVSKAVKEAYGSSIEEGKLPLFVLHVTISPSLVDVNVHPQKREVRFSLDEEIKHACEALIAKELFKVPISHSERPVELKPQTFSFTTKPLPPSQPKEVPKFEGVTLPFRIIGTHWHYIFADLQDEESFAIIDAKKALSRITQEALHNRQEKAPSQTLLVPLFVELTLSEAALLKEKLASFQEIGINIYEFGHTAFMIDAAPPAFDHVDIPEYIRASLSDEGAKLEELAHRNVRVPSPLHEGQAALIMKKLLLCHEPWISSLGEPLVVHVKKAELQKRFFS